MNCKRVSTVKAVTFAELCVLSRAVFNQVTDKYTEDHEIIVKFITEKYDPEVLQSVMAMQMDPKKEQQKAILDVLHQITDRLGDIEGTLMRLDTKTSQLEKTHGTDRPTLELS